MEELLDWYFNQQPYGGAVAKDHGKPRQQVYNENLHTKRVASAEDLNLMLMRSSRAQKVTRRGVHLDIAGQRIDYWNDELVFNYLGQQVYYRYDPDDLSEVRVYDLQDRFIMSVPADNTAVLTYGASKEEVKEAMARCGAWSASPRRPRRSAPSRPSGGIRRWSWLWRPPTRARSPGSSPLHPRRYWSCSGLMRSHC